jgi:nucleotide-binding universal stress UspA family protein
MTELIASSAATGLLDPRAPAALLTARPENPVRRGPIVLALRGAESSPAPIALAHRLAQRLHVFLEVVTVGEPMVVPVEFGIAPVPALQHDFAAVEEESIRRSVREVCGDKNWGLTIRYGSPAREIARRAEEVNATFIVVGAAPHHGFRQHVAGVRALQVLRRAPCPVLSVAPDVDVLPRTVIAAIDSSPASIRAAEAGLLVLDDGGRLILAHAPFPIALKHVVQEHTGALLGVDLAATFARLCRELEPHLPPNATLETRQLHGKVGPAILDVASAERANLITVGRHSRNVVERLFVGSVATEVMHAATCSVLGSPDPSVCETVRLKLRMTDSAVTEKASEWSDVLNAASERNAGRKVTLEEDDPSLGSQIQASGFVLTGIDYDEAARRVDVMLGRTGGGTDHLTRSIRSVNTVGIKSDASGRDQAIEIVHGKGFTLLHFD